MVQKILSNEEGSAAKKFMLSSVFWIVVGMGAGLLAASLFSYPDITKGIEQLTMPRLRTAHLNTVVFGWLSMANVGAALFIIPALCKTKLYSEKLGNFTC